MSDVLLFQTNDNGEINIINGIVELSSGLETAAYLSLFGGNEEDAGFNQDVTTWWGNVDENDIARRYKSETQYLLNILPANTGNMRRLESAALRDLDWFVNEKIASSIDVIASIPDLNKVNILIIIMAQGIEHTFKFTENWKVI